MGASERIPVLGANEEVSAPRKRSSRLAKATLGLISRLPVSSFKTRLILGLIRLPGVGRVSVAYMSEGVPLTVSVLAGDQTYKVTAEDSLFQFNTLLGFMLGLSRVDIEREGVRIRFGWRGRTELQRQSEPNGFDGFVIRQNKQ